MTEQERPWIPLDWHELHNECAVEMGMRFPPSDPQPAVQLLAPLFRDYAGPLASLILQGCYDLRPLNTRLRWLVRDGRVPLIWFFRRFPKPGDLETVLLIHESAIDVVPPAWRPFVQTYRLAALPSSAPGQKLPVVREQRPYGLLLVGLNTTTVVPMDWLDARLERLSHELTELGLPENGEVFACLPIRWAARQREDTEYARLVSTVVRRIGRRVHFISEGELERTFDWSRFVACELNDHLICADSFFMHLLAERGARLLDVRELEPEEKLVGFHSRYGFALKEPAAADEARSAQVTAHALRSRANEGFAWDIDREILPKAVLQKSPSTGRPEHLLVNERGFPVVSHGEYAHVEKIERHSSALNVFGWSRVSNAGAPDRVFYAIQGERCLLSRSKCCPRPDIARHFLGQDADGQRCGFEISLLGDGSEEPIWIVERDREGLAHVTAVIQGETVLEAGAPPK